MSAATDELLCALVGGPQLPAAEQVHAMGLWERPPLEPGRVRLLLNMVSTLDGRASLGGRSGPISGPADRALFHALRSAVDAILVGAGTARSERYGRVIPDADTRALRRRRGLEPEPLAVVVSHSGHLGQLPLLDEPQARVVLAGPAQGELPPSAASVEYVRTSGPELDLATVLGELRGRLGVHTVLCEGGPSLGRALLAAGLIDELLLSLAPVLAGGDGPEGAALRILAGAELEQPAQLELRGVLRSGPWLFLRYGVDARVSRETIDSSSLAR